MQEFNQLFNRIATGTNDQVDSALREAGQMLMAAARPAPVFDRGAVVAVGDEPGEVVMQKGRRVFVRDADGKIAEFDSQRVTQL